MEKLFQKRLFNSEREFKLSKQRLLKIRIRSFRGRSSRYCIDLLALDPTGKRQIHFAWSWLIAAGIVGGLAFVLGVLQGWLEDTTLQQGLQALAALGAISTIALLFFFFTRSSFERVYTAYYSDIPLVRLLNNLPDKEQFKQFTEQLESLITQLHEHHNMSVETQLAGEMKMLRRLVKEKIVSTDVYEKAKNELFRVTNELSKKEE
ncbi:MAG: hypothetical protein OQK73_05920 [Gammaproteobacteria bacterium]|nr:hypothetical protein [Gammaproteobacteria bacterium]